MPLCSLKTLLADATAGSYAVGYFEPWDQYSMEAVVQAAEDVGAPVIIGCGGVMMDQDWFDATGMASLAAMGRVMAERASVPAALLLNEVVNFDQIVRGLAWGFNAVMLESSHLAYDRNLELTCKVADAAHAAGASVEGALGHLPFGDEPDDDPQASLTDPQQAADFVRHSGVDALSVAIGNVHAMAGGTSAAVDLDRLARIRSQVDVPLVIHGGTGFPDEAVEPAIRLGVAKFNVGTVMKRLFWEGLRQAAAGTDRQADPQVVVGSRKGEDLVLRACEPLGQEIRRRIRLYRQI